mmetsp:Transcript_4530/g.10022  ORF Transcript_4530/g.10022 Transcript_4530/m.10022 type:complete len:203 (-) Transcript_4530:371-979(-)
MQGRPALGIGRGDGVDAVVRQRLERLLRGPVGARVVQRQHAVLVREQRRARPAEQAHGVLAGRALRVPQGEVQRGPLALVRPGLAVGELLGQQDQHLLAGLVGAGVVQGEPAEAVGPADGLRGGADEHADDVHGGAVAARQVEGRGVVVPALRGGQAGVGGGVAAQPLPDGVPGGGAEGRGRVAQGLQVGQGGGAGGVAGGG